MSAWSWLPATITSSSPASARPRSSKNGRAAASASRSRPVAQLEHVAEQDHAVGVSGGLEQRARAARRGAAGRSASDAAEVQVGDDQRAHRSPAGHAPTAGCAEPSNGRMLRRRPDHAVRARRPGDGLANLLGQHEADVLADDIELGDVAARRARGTSRRARSTRFSGALAPEEMPTTRLPSSHSSRDLAARCRSGAPRCRSRGRPPPGAPSSTSCASRSRASGRSCAAICLTAAWRLVVA